jgi:hypothetical protein
VDERDLLRDLSRLVRGELSSADAARAAEREGYPSFAALCEARLPEALPRVKIGTREVLARIERYRKRGIELRELQAWADQLARVTFHHQVALEARCEDLVASSLSALAVVANERLFPNRSKAERSLEVVRACLLRRRKLQLRNIFLRIFEDLDVAHLANKHAAELALDDGLDDEGGRGFSSEEAGGAEGGSGSSGEGAGAPDTHVGGGDGDGDGDDEDGRSRWADVVLLDAPFDASRDIFTGYEWLVAFTVTARSLYEEERRAEGAGDDVMEDAAEDSAPPPEAEARPALPDAGAAAPGAGPEAESAGPAPAPSLEPALASGRRGARRIRPAPREAGPLHDRVPALRRLVPNFDFESKKPCYLYDGDGIAEIVLDVPRIGPAEVRYATKLFCLANRVRTAFLDGESVKTLLVRPGAGRARERRAG